MLPETKLGRLHEKHTVNIWRFHEKALLLHHLNTRGNPKTNYRERPAAPTPTNK